MEGGSVSVTVDVSVTSPGGSNAGSTTGSTTVKMNGTAGSGSSSHKDKHKEKHSSSSSSSKHKHKDKDREHSSHSSHHKSSHKSSSSDKDRSSSTKHSSSKDSSSPSKHHSSSSHKSSHKDSHKDKNKEKSSHSSSGNKSSSSGDKHKSEHKSEHKDKSKEKRDKDGKSSSSSSHKHKSSSGSSEKKSEGKKEEKVKEEIKTEVKKEVKKEFEDEDFVSPAPVNTVKTDDVKVKKEPEPKRASSDDEGSPQKRVKREEVKKEKKYVEEEAEDDDGEPWQQVQKKKGKKEAKVKEEKNYTEEEEDEPEDDNDDDDSWGQKKKKKKAKKATPAKGKQEKRKAEAVASTSPKKKAKTSATPAMPTASPTKGGKKKEQEPPAEVWKWWEEEKLDDGSKWKFLEHKGVCFPPEYEALPDHVTFKYDGQKIKLSLAAEEIATFYARMLEHDYTTKDAFNQNFFRDWRKNMSEKEQKLIKDLGKCDFRPMHKYFVEQSELRKNRTKEEKKATKEEAQAMVDEYGWANIDGHKQKIGNFRIEPPGLFRGRGDHPKMGTLKKRVLPEDVMINCSKGSVWPKPPAGHKWKEVRHDNAVTWLAGWTENVQNQNKYVMLGVTSRLKGEKDWMKYETARTLHHKIDKIRADYEHDMSSKEMRLRQRSVALYFIDKLALRAGNEKDADEAADTVGCCSLRVEHITLHKEKDGKEFVVEFDFLGKDSIRYHNEVPVEKQAYKNLKLFMENKKPSDDLFDRLSTSTLNEYLRELMEGLTAKVFRTYNASRTLEEELQRLTEPDDPLVAKVLSYNRANRSVAVLCNHQRAVSKTHGAQMERAQEKIEDKRKAVKDCEKTAKEAKQDLKATKTQVAMNNYEKKKKAVERLKEQLAKLEMGMLDKEEGKTISLGTSKLNYLDPRISVAWTKKWDIPVEKVYNKTQKEKFSWAIDMATADYEFLTASEAQLDSSKAKKTKKKKEESDEEDDDDNDDDED